MKRVLIILAVASAWCGMAQAREMSDADKARSSMRHMVRCAVDQDNFFDKGRGVIGVLSQPADPTSFGQFYGGLRRCLALTNSDDRGVQLRFSQELLRGQVLRAMVIDRWGFRRHKDLMPEFRRLANATRDASTNPLTAFGICVAMLDPVNARVAIDSRTAGEEEDAAYAALMPAMEECIAPGSQIAFSKQVLEGAFAEGLFVQMYATPVDVAMQEAAK